MLTALGLSLTAPLTIADAPFGIPMGAPLTTLGECVPAAQIGIHVCKTVPVPHSAFDRYVVKSQPNVGICTVIGYGKSLDGIWAVKRETDHLAAQITNSYGPQILKIDQSNNVGRIVYYPDMLQAIANKQYSYYYAWLDSPTLALKSDLQSITVEAKSSNGVSGYVWLQFDFDNVDQCEQEIAKAKAEKDQKDSEAFK